MPYESTLVVDNGSFALKVGFSGTDVPAAVIRSVVGEYKYAKLGSGGYVTGVLSQGERDRERMGVPASGSSAKNIDASGLVVGSGVTQANMGLLRLRWPMEKGVIEYWHDMELLWASMYGDLKVAPESHPVLLTEAPLNPILAREKCGEIFFEGFSVPALFIGSTAVLAMYGAGLTSGALLDVGDTVSYAVPMCDGFSFPHAVKRNEVAGREVTEYLSLLLRRLGITMTSTSEKEFVRMMKEERCTVSVRSLSKDDDGLGMNLKSTKESDKSQGADMILGVGPETYKLPDGNEIKLPGSVRVRAPELLFNPSLLGHEDPGLAEMLHTCIQAVDLATQPKLYSSIVLNGGSTMLDGFVDRISWEMKDRCFRDTAISVVAPHNRVTATFAGGSILSSLSTFKQLWVTEEEYKESGASALHRKTL